MRLIHKIVVFVALCPAFVLADYIEPATLTVSTPRPSLDRIIYRPGRYTYAVKWQGIPVATSEVTIENAGIDRSNGSQEIRVKATAQTARVIDLLYKLRHTSQSVFEINEFKPLRFFTAQTENSKFRAREISFLEDGRVVSKSWKDAVDSTPEEQKEFNPHNFMLDPVSAAMFARSIPISPGLHVAFDVWNGKHRFLISFEVIGEEMVKVGDEKRRAFKIIPSVKKLTDSEGEKRLESAVLWVSADDGRDILRIESKVFIGKISATLEKFEPATNTTPGPIQASLAETAKSVLLR